MTHDPRRLSDDPAEPELARALREAQGDVLSPEAVARVRAALAMTGAAGLGAGLRSPLAKLLAAAARLGVGLACLGLAAGAGVVVMRRASTHAGSASVPPAPSAATTAAPAEGSAAAAPDALPEATPTATAVETSRARAGARATGETPATRPSAAGANPSPREGALLLEARRALGTDPARALTLVREHEQEFPRSQLERERRRIAAEARQRLEKGGVP